ncbi:kinesin-like protein unc-104 [Pocillopora damicornis]|uniref:kinesin-like protein unc-104 n=1 Tax=Pocillopora damicornis TaxID=46731 RepID=UPI000F558D04|nr:kinesin-like protein unc-104 [Pocillopora damicornis]
MSDGEAENVKVAVRVRPFNKREKARNATLIVEMKGQTTYLTNPEEPGEEPKKFTFDYSYWSHDGFEEKPNGYLGATNPKYADQMKVYNDLGKGVLTNAWEGFNTSLFAYGQTGSGKSWSIVGYGTNKGIVPIFCEEIFKGIDEKKQGGDEAQFEVFFSMLEIYNEKVRDLLNPSTNKGGLRVRQHPSKGFYADGLKTVPVSEYKDIEMRMEEGTTNRTVAATNIAAISPADINYDETLSTLRYADRAKQIKTSAKVNEDPTEKLIRELKEENDKLMEMLKKAQAGESVKISADDDDDDGEKEGLSEEEMAELRKQIEEEIKASMAQTEQETQDMNKSWDDRVAENKKDIKDKEAEKKERQSTPHLWNLNPDPQLTGMIVHMVKSGVVKVGNKKGDPPADIVLHGLNILKQHCEIKNEGSKKITIKTFGEAKVLVNGEPVDDDEEEELHHLDRVMFGTSHLYVFHHPAEAQSSSLKQADITYEMAQEEIAKNAGLDVDDQESKEAMLLREDLADLMPMVNEANAISQELDKKVSFEVSVVSAKARGLPEGRPEPYVVMRDLQTGVEYLWPKAKFINRKYVMDEMYENFEDGDDWQLEDEKDPFTESPDVESLIGCVAVPMQSLGYVLDMREQLSITDYKGKELGYLNVEVVPLNENGKEITEEDDIFIDDPSQLEGKKLVFVVRVQSAKGIPKRYTDVYCKYSMYLEADLKTEVKSGTRNPEFNYERTFSFERVPPKLIQFLKNKEVIIQLWGKQVVDKKPVNKTAKKGKDTKAIMRAETLKKNVSLTPAVVKGMADNATLKKQNKRLQDKMNHLRQLCDKKQSEGKSDVPISELRAIIGEMNSNTQTTAPHASAPATTGRAPAERRNESSACTIL